MKMVIVGSKYDGPDLCRLKLHEEYGRVWLYVCDADGRSLQNGRLLCIEEDGKLNIHCDWTWTGTNDQTINLRLPKLAPSSSERIPLLGLSSQQNVRRHSRRDQSSLEKTSPSRPLLEPTQELDQTSKPE